MDKDPMDKDHMNEKREDASSVGPDVCEKGTLPKDTPQEECPQGATHKEASGERRPPGERSSGIAMSGKTLVGKELDRARKNTPVEETRTGQEADAGPSPSHKPGLARRFGQRLSQATGWSYGRRFLATLSLKGPYALWKRTSERLLDNLAREDEARGDFSRLLRLWGIREEEIELARAARTREAVGTGFLTLVSTAFLVANVLNPSPSALVRPLALFAAASFLLASLLMSLSALWRARVLANRRFVPFTSWLLSPLAHARDEEAGRVRGANDDAGNSRPARGYGDARDKARKDVTAGSPKRPLARR